MGRPGTFFAFRNSLQDTVNCVKILVCEKNENPFRLENVYGWKKGKEEKAEKAS